MAILGLQSCYEDKGNYSYHFDQINNVDTIIFKPQAYTDGYEPTIAAGLNENTYQIDYIKPGKTDTIDARIDVELVTSIPEEIQNFEYYWYRSYQWGNQNVKDTVRTPGYMTIKIPGDNTISYSVMLEVRDTKNELSKFVTVTIRTKEWFTNSLFVLHGNGSGNMHLGNVEFSDQGFTVTPDAFERVNKDESKQNPFARTRLLGFRTSYFDGSELLCFNTDGTAEVYNPFGLARIFNTQFVMPTSSEPFIAKSFINYCPSSSGNDFRAVTSTEGKFYKSRGYFRFFEPAKDTESAENITPDQYKVAGGIMTDGYYLFYDRQNYRFIYTVTNDGFNAGNPNAGRDEQKMTNPVLDAGIDMSILPDEYKLNGNKEFVYAYINYFDYYALGQESRFIFYDQNTQTNYMYELTPQDNKDDKDGKSKESTDSRFSISNYSKLEDIKLEPGTPIIYNPAYTLDFIFYAEGGTVYRYNVSNGEKGVIYEAPAGYEVSVLKFRQNDNYYLWGKLYLYLTIGLNQGSKGAVAEVKLLTSGDVDESWGPKLYEGFDNIMDVQFCNELTYSIN